MTYIISLVSYFVPYYMGIRHLMISYTHEVCSVFSRKYTLVLYKVHGKQTLLRKPYIIDMAEKYTNFWESMYFKKKYELFLLLIWILNLAHLTQKLCHS